MSVAVPTHKGEATGTTEQIVEWCWVKDMFVDARFQRPLHEPTVKKIVAGFDIDQLGLPFVNIRGAKLSVIDGSHRVAAARELGMRKLLCEVVQVSEEEEARLFTDRNRNRRPIKPIDTHRSAVFHGNPEAVEIEEIAHSLGYVVSQATQNNALRAVAMLYRVYRNQGPDVLKATLTVIKEAWGFEYPQATSASMIGGMGRFLNRYLPAMKDRGLENFVARLSGTRPATVLAGAATYSGTAHPDSHKLVAIELVAIYNKGRQASGRLKPYDE